jgi:hypothetical protein
MSAIEECLVVDGPRGNLLLPHHLDNVSPSLIPIFLL